ncbi:hypothetical protein OCOJLMKI_0396 [Methylobacterium iners]|uniref:Acyltransferase 3 domain-containing protein n=1 Tax=Methylobacterium iners TaxID=418707 RepID=A0ABQ4RS83_9HYPH|nr:hypothetical protein OCOJLMKI_0396 [Methylobacterium iners]
MTLAPIQVLRGFAALLVVVHHAQFEGVVLAGRTSRSFEPSTLLPWAAGVDIFFVISGFIIVHAAAPLYGRRDGRRRFLAHRVARLVPLYWLTTALYLAVLLAAPALLASNAALEPGYVLASFLFWPALSPDGQPQPLYSLGWTLNFEMFFYALFAVALPWGRRIAFAWVAASLSLLVTLRLSVPGLPQPLAFWGAPIVLEFALGAALGLARAEGLRLAALPRLCLAAAGIAWLMSVAGEPDLAMRPLAYGLPGLLLVAAAGLGPPRRGPEPLPLRWGVGLGDASYALYLAHPFVLRAAREILLRTGAGAWIGPWAGIALMIGLAVAAAILVHHGIERRLTAHARRLLDRRPAEPRPA